MREALGELQRLGAAPAAAIVTRRLRERGARGVPRGPRPATRANDLGLTQREVEVLALLATGQTDREIAESLFISKKTASVHVSNLLRKLDVTNRVEAGKVGQAQGLG